MPYCGLTRITYTAAGFIVSGGDHHPSRSGPLLRGLENTLTHEAAHAIGFFGHDPSGSIMSPTGNGDITSQNGTFFKMLYTLVPGTEITGFLGKKRIISSTKFNKSGSRVFTLVIPRRCACAR